MAGITDRPFRQLCREFGAGMAVSEMVSSNPALRDHQRTRLRVDHAGEAEPRSVQILGTEPTQMANFARHNAERGAQIIDINLGCPAKKVCSAAAGSALLKDEALVGRILGAVVRAVDVPVTVKIRTGWDAANRNALRIATIAQESGIQAITVHGRTRACGFAGHAEYATIRLIKQAVRIPVIANGDIDTPEKARAVLDSTGADAVMIGRAALGRPWLFRGMRRHLAGGPSFASLDQAEARAVVTGHLQALHDFYGAFVGVRIARKHLGWYMKSLLGAMPPEMQAINRVEHPEEQLVLVDRLFDYPSFKELAA
jgi:tRNA-dihydrouridine synthase B